MPTRAHNHRHFNRFAYVGISAPWGTLTTGRLGGVQYDYTILGGYDPAYGSTMGFGSLNAIPIQILKIANSVKYTTPSYAGISSSVMYSIGQELPGNTNAGRYVGAVLAYAKDDFKTRITYERTNGTVATADLSKEVDNRFSAAARYTLGQWELYASYVKVGGDLALSPKGKIYIGSVGYNWTPVIHLVAQVGQYNLQAGDHVRFASIMSTYNLSRRTLLYATAARMLNAASTNFAIVYPNVTSMNGQDQSTFAIGVRHAF